MANIKVVIEKSKVNERDKFRLLVDGSELHMTAWASMDYNSLDEIQPDDLGKLLVTVGKRLGEIAGYNLLDLDKLKEDIK